MNKKNFMFVVFYFFTFFVYGLNIGTEPEKSGQQLLTPDPEINQQIRGKNIKTVDFFGFKPNEKELIILPQLKPDWTWMAAKNVAYKDRTISFFLYDGYIFVDTDIRSNFRPRKAQKDVSDLVKSNTFHIAFKKERGKDSELWIFIAASVGKRVELMIHDSLLGKEKQLFYDMDAGEAKFLRIAGAIDRPEWAPMYFESEEPLREQVNLNCGWKFLKGDVSDGNEIMIDDSQWKVVNLPHSWNATDIFDNRNINEGLDIYTSYWRGKCWYRKWFDVCKKYEGKQIFVEFEAANQVADVWINGVYLGQHIGGYLGFQFDITDFIRFDESNLLAVRVDNRYNYDIAPHIADFNMMGGITRDVWLKVTDRIHVVSTYVTTPEVSRRFAAVKVVTEVKNNTDDAKDIILVTNVVDPDGFIAASMKHNARIEKHGVKIFTQESETIYYPRLWSPKEPNLYTVYSHVYVGDDLVDEFSSPLGFRWFAFDAQKGFFLNGQYWKLRGVNLHQDRFGFGSAVPDSLRVQDLVMLKKMGINFIRLSHYPHDPVILDECDRLGIIVWEEVPYVNTTGREKFVENTSNMMREMILRDRNHASIAFWGIGNEMAMESLADSEVPHIRNMLETLNDLAHDLDPTRLTVQAHNHLIDFSLIEITDVMGFNRYFGWYEGVISDFGGVMDKLHKDYPNLKILISEYGAGAKRGYHVEKPEKFDFSEDYQLLFHEGYLKQINERAWIGGSLVWNGCDFASQAKIGNIPRINQKGLIDYKRKPKDTYYFYKSQWTDEPMVYIVSHTWTNRRGSEGEKKRIRVLSNCDKVELFVNEKSLGRKKKGFVWNLRFRGGENVLRVVGNKGGRVVCDEMRVFYFVRE